MAKFIEMKIYVEPERDGDAFLRFAELMERLHCDTYPTHVDAEEIEAGNNSDEASAQTVEIPPEDIDLWDFLEECGVFDNL